MHGTPTHPLLSTSLHFSVPILATPQGHLFPLPGPDGSLPPPAPGTSAYYPDIWPKYWQVGALPAGECRRGRGRAREGEVGGEVGRQGEGGLVSSAGSRGG